MAAEKRHPAKRILRAIGPLLFVVAGCLSFASPASAVTACGTNGVLSAVGNVLTCTYTMSGEDTFNAPLFVTTVHVVAVGQTGGIGSADENVQAAGAGGAGARVAADLPVTQSTLFVEIPATFDPVQKGQGCQADNGDTILCDGGGGGSGDALGGGASVVQTCSVSSSCVLTGNPLTDPRLVVAGGGGGGAFNDTSGGNAGTGPNPVCNLGQKGQSGQGAPPPAVMGGGGSGGGCQVPGWGAGGSGGIGPGGFAANGHMGDSGQVGAGGDGGAKAADPQVIPGCVFVWGGAGGGSGFWGGGGGGGAAGCSGGGGGGGSSFAEVHASNVSMTPDPLATPSVSISWVQPVNREYQFLTGRAVGLSFTQSAPNPGSVTDADTGPVQSSMTETVSPPCQTSVNAPVGGTGTTITDIHTCAEVVTTGGSQLISKSMAGATIRGLILRIPGLPVVKALTVISASKTTCAGSTGATYIGFLSIGSDVLISHPQLIAPNTHLSVGQISVNLNEQTPFNLPADRGLLVDAITLSIGSPSSVTAHLVVASSESDIGDCPGQVHIN